MAGTDPYHNPFPTALEPWRAQAACRGMDPATFYPERSEATKAVKAICAGCSVREECLEFALTTSEKIGIWGGLSERERRQLRRTRRMTPTCGTRSGYLAHRSRGETACALCRTADNEWQAAWRRRAS